MLKEGQIYKDKNGTVIIIKRIYKDTRFLLPPSPENPLLDFVDVCVDGVFMPHLIAKGVIFSIQYGKFIKVDTPSSSEWD